MTRAWTAPLLLLLALGPGGGARAEEPVRIGPFTLGEITTTLTLENTRIPGPPAFGDAPVVRWDTAHVDVDLVALLRGHTRVTRLRIEAAHVTLVRDRDGEWNFAALQAAEQATPQPAADTATVSPDARTFAVDEIVVSAGTLTLIDHTVAGPPATITLTNLELTVRDLYAPMPPDRMQTTVDLRAEWAGAPGSRLVVKGRGNFLNDERPFDLRITIDDAPLTLFSPYYSGRAITIEGGVMDATIVGGCRRNQLDAQVDLNIRDMRVATSGTTVATHIYGQSAAQFVRLVHANGGNFQLNFPVRGSLDNPDFSPDIALARQFTLAATAGIAMAADALAKTGLSLKDKLTGREGEPRGLKDSLLGK